MDLREFPLVRILSPHVASYDHVNVPSFFECVDRGLERDEQFAILHDARALPHVDDARRIDFMEHIERRRAAIHARVAGYAAVVGTPLERGVVTAFMWFVKLPIPLRIFASEPEARRWLSERLAERSVNPRRSQAPFA